MFTYATCALVRGRSSRRHEEAGVIAGYLGLSSPEVGSALPLILEHADCATPLEATAALTSFFEPEEWVTHLANLVIQRAAQRASVRVERRPVAHIQPAQYEHPDDSRALAAVRSVTGVELALRKISELGVEKVEAIENIANCVRVGPQQFPDLYALFREAVEALGMPRMPDLFVRAMGPNAYTVGIQCPRVILSYTLPALLSRDELLFVIGHELGHVRSGHAPFAMLQRILPQLAETVGQVTLGIGALVGMGMQAALMDWYRKSELTCDRCGLLVCQNSDAALSALMKLAGAPTVFYRQMNLDAFLAQAEEYDRLDTSVLSKLYKFSRALDNDHPWLAVRARELVRWVHAGEYERLLGGVPSGGAACSGCGAPLSREDAFCCACGARAPQR